MLSTNGKNINPQEFKNWLDANCKGYHYLTENEETLEFETEIIDFDPDEVFNQCLDDSLDFDFRNSLETDFENELLIV